MPIGDDARRTPAPRSIVVGGWLVAFEGAVAVLGALVFLVRRLGGAEHGVSDGYGLALWFGLLGSAVLVGGVALTRSRRWGKSIAVVAQILLIPVSYYLFTSHQPLFGIPLGGVALAVLGCLFNPAAAGWFARDYAPDAHLD